MLAMLKGEKGREASLQAESGTYVRAATTGNFVEMVVRSKARLHTVAAMLGTVAATVVAPLAAAEILAPFAAYLVARWSDHASSQGYTPQPSIRALNRSWVAEPFNTGGVDRGQWPAGTFAGAAKWGQEQPDLRGQAEPYLHTICDYGSEFGCARLRWSTWQGLYWACLRILWSWHSLIG